MKKNSISSRVLAMVLALIMVVSIIPANVFAAKIGDLYAGDTGIDTTTLGKDGFINWPIKLYDYLDDGLLFETAQANIIDSHVECKDNYYYDIENLYGGGENAPIIEEGSDFTGNAWFSTKTSPWDTIGIANRFNEIKMSPQDYTHSTETTDDDPFVNPRFLRVTLKPKSTDSTSLYLKHFAITTSRRSTAYIKLSAIRYMVLVYKATGLEDETDLKIGYAKSGTDLTADIKLTDSAKWVAKVVDARSVLGASTYNSNTSTNITGLYLNMPSLDESDILDISHVAFFDSSFKASHFASRAENFCNTPGELLKLNVNITSQTSNKYTLPVVQKPDYILSYNHRYVSSATDSYTATDKGVYYGLDFTTKDTSNGAFTSGYNSKVFQGWDTASKLTMNGSEWTNSAMTVTDSTESQGQKYINLSNAANKTGRSRILLTTFREDTTDEVALSGVNYAVLVYRTHGLTTSDNYAFWAYGSDKRVGFIGPSQYPSNGKAGAIANPQNFVISEDEWLYVVVDLKATLGAVDSNMNSVTKLKHVGIHLPALTNGKSIDLAYVGYFDNTLVANYFGASAAGYMNGGKTVESVSGQTVSLSDRDWAAGNNIAFGFLYSSQGGGWSGGIYGSETFTNPSNGYHTWRIGYDTLNGYDASSNTTRRDIYGKKYSAYYTGKDPSSGNAALATPSAGSTTNNIFYVNSNGNDGTSQAGYDMSKLDLDGYNLLSTLTSGGMTAGLLEGTLKDGRPVYRQETVEFLAQLLFSTLPIPQMDADGDYNYNFVAGAPNTALGGVDLNGDGKIGRADLNGDNYEETDEARVDMATALRACLGVRFTLGKDRGTNPAVGSYNQTVNKNLIGEFKDVRDNITTCMDAAYFLLNNLFYANSYNQAQDEYSYLKMDRATMDNGKSAYVFDAAYTTGTGYAEGSTISQTSNYVNTSKSSIIYDPHVKINADGTITTGTGTISMENVHSKDMHFWSTKNYSTLNPFLPITHSEGDFAGETTPYYFYDEGVSSLQHNKVTYTDRNYNYVMACNGEFVYHEKDGLFFEFEGDDDVYLFINGELVMDLGGAHSISNESLEVNDYVEWARAIVKAVEEAGGDYTKAGYTAREYERAKKLDLIEGEICQFDFYYMERHGTGANCRIVTNMRVTDPELRTEKTASQMGEEKLEDIPYGGAVAYEEPIAYNFKLTNTGNTKLYNLTFEDKSIGVTLDYMNGLQVTGTYQGLNVNGFYVLDKTNGELTASDLTADVVGYKYVGVGNGAYIKTDEGDYIEAVGGSYDYAAVTDITFKDNQALINFLKTLSADGLDNTTVDEELTQQGQGLWVDATVTIKGIYYLMTDDNIEEGFFDNTVYVTATTRTDPNASGSRTLRSSANHRVYISGDPVYFQWAGHDLYLNLQMILSDSTKAAGTGTGGQLSQYQEFFKAANNQISNVNTMIADKNGNAYNYNEIKWASTGDGVLVNYADSGTQAFYLYMSLKNDKYNGEAGIQDGEYAIVRVTVNVASVQDSVYVLDYGLQSENLDTGNELFKNDQLLGTSSGAIAKLMAISTAQPYYLNYSSNQTSYNRIHFDPISISSTGRIWTNNNQYDSQGCWTVKMDIPENGRHITYSAYTGGYSLTDVGTVSIHADVPFTWDDVYLYWWYNNGVSNGAFPGQHMARSRAGKFGLDIPADVPHLIISHPVTDDNGNTVYLQTDDLNLVSGRDAWITLDGTTKGGTVSSTDHLNADVSYSTQTVSMHATVPDDWANVYLYYRNESGIVDEDHPEWPGVQMKANADGSYTAADLPGDISHIIINNGGNGKQTNEMTVFAGSEIWINVSESANVNWHVSNNSTATSTPIKINGIPESWNNVYLYYWEDGGNNFGNGWPGVQLTTKDENGNYIYDLPAAADWIIVNNGDGTQTKNIPVVASRETEITLTSDMNNVILSYNTEGNFTVNATVPGNWGDNINLYYWDSMNDAFVRPEWPGTAMGVIHDNNTGENTYTLTIPNSASYVIINDGTNQSSDLAVIPGVTNEITITSTYSATLLYTQDTVKIHATVPESWKDGTSDENPLVVSLYCWDNNENKPAGDWPGTAMTLEDINGKLWYTLEIPADVTNVIINNNNNGKQTADLTITEGLETWIEVTDDLNEKGQYTAKIGYGTSAGEEGFFFTPINFMDKAYHLYMAVTVHDENETPTPLGEPIDIHNEVQMYKKITVLPANVVYYEDDFHGIVYDTSTGNNFTHVGDGSGSLKQSVDQKQEYGQDAYYGNGVNDAYSGDSLTKIQINNIKDIASFTFSGTGFEIIGRTNATDAGTIMVKVYDAAAYANDPTNATPYMQVPVINEFDNGANGGLDSIEQVPVVRISDLDYGSYTAVINGIPTYNFDNWDGEENNMPVKETYLYIDGVRIFQPYNNGVSELYRPAESGAGFYEIRNMILDKQVFVISTNTNESTANGNKTIQISGGMNTWTENRNGANQAGNAWTGNAVSSAADYLFAGPNNEAYLAAVQSNPSALAFYVQETDSENKELQVAVRAIDYGSFFGNRSIGLNAQLQLGVVADDGSYAWMPLATVVSGTEQYYTIPYTKCPFDQTNNRYQIVLRVVSGDEVDVTGMVSLTSLKTNGLTIPTLSGDKYELTYTYADNTLTSSIDGESVNASEYVNFRMIMTQMNSNLIVLDVDTDSDDTTSGDTGSNKASITQKGRTLSYEDLIYVIDVFNLTGVEGIDLSKDAGLLIWSVEEFEALSEIAFDAAHANVGLTPYKDTGYFCGSSDGIFTSDLHKEAYYVGYVKLADGSYIYSEPKLYSPAIYAYNMLAKESSRQETKELCVALLNYISAAQLYFNSNTPAEYLVNYDLSEEQKALNWNNVSFNLTPEVSADKQVARDESVFTGTGKNLLFEEMISIVSIFKVDDSIIADAKESGTIFWTAEQFAALEGAPSIDNIGEGTKVALSQYRGNADQWCSHAPAVTAKDMADTQYYYLGYVVHADGSVSYSGVISYTVEQYISNKVNSEDTSDTMLTFAQRLYYYERAVKAALG